MKEDNASVIKDTYGKFIEPRLVDLQSGDYVQASAEEINKFEPKDAVKDPAKAKLFPAEADKAGIKVRANQARVYLVKDGAINFKNFKRNSLEMGTVQIIVTTEGNFLYVRY